MEVQDRVHDEAASRWVFFRQWLRNPLAVAAVSPSSRQLARRIVAELPANARRVVELGGGTGAITRAVLAHGVAPQDLLVVELNPDLHRHLRRRFPKVPIVRGDARDVDRLANECGFAAGGPIDAVISGLGLLSMPRQAQREILRAAFAVLAPQGRLIQFTYGPVNPVPAEVLQDLGLVSIRSRLTWWNLPPATIWVYSRSRSVGIDAKPARLR